MEAISFKNVTKKRGDFHIQQFDLQIKRGYITGLVGPNGSGKTSLISLIMGLMQVDHGSITVLDGTMEQLSIKQRIGFVYDELHMYDDFTVKKMHQVIAPLYDNWNEALFQQYLDLFQLPYRKKLKHFSKGMQMKCSLLFALSHEPELLIMDEPTAGLDPVFRREMLGFIQDLMVREEQTVLFATHITSDLDKIADYIIFLDGAQVKMHHSMETLQENFHLIRGKKDILDRDVRQLLMGVEESDVGFTGLYKGDPSLFTEADPAIVIEKATLEDILFFTNKM